MKKQLFFMLCVFVHMQALRLDRVILATDANPDYIEFWPIVSKAWKEVVGIKPTLALIASSDIEIDESLGDVIRFEPIEGIPTSFQAQVIRLLLPVLYPNDGCILSDIDMIPLKKSYFIDSIKDCPDDSFVVYRDKAYNADEQKYPMCYLAARGSVFEEIFQVQTLEDIRAKIIELHAFDLGWNTDELMLYYYVHAWYGFNDRCIHLGHGVEPRVDRSYWQYDPQLVRQGCYVDAHCPRPYSQYKESIDALIFSSNAKFNKILMHPYDKYLLRARYPLGDLHVTGEVNIIKNLINDGDVVFDVGANCGDWTREVFIHAQPKKVYAFEPVPKVAHLFRENVVDERVSLHELALSNNTGERSFFYYPRCEGVCEDGALSSLYQRARVESLYAMESQEISVATVTLDAFCDEHEIDRIQFLKIDTEGAEWDVLQGAKGFIQNQKIDFIQFEYGQTYVDSKRTLKQIYEFLTLHGYAMFKVHVNGLVHMRWWIDSFEDFYQSNFLAISLPILKNSGVLDVLMSMGKPEGRSLENADSGSHMSMLLTAVTHTAGPILEMGAGDYSTPLLHAICSKTKRFVVTADTSKNLLYNFLDLQTDWHVFSYVPVYEDDWSVNPKPEMWDGVGLEVFWSVVLINHRPGERRVKDIERLRPHTKIFVVHDTQESGYGYETLLNSFKYKYVDDRYATETTLVSDTVDVSKFFIN